MKKTIQKHLTIAAIALMIVIALSATAFADSRQMGDPPQGGMQMDQQMGGPQGDFGQDGQQGGFGRDQQMGGPQGDFGQNGQQNSFSRDQQMAGPQGDFGQNNSQQPPEKPEGNEDRTPPEDGENGFGRNNQMRRDGRDPMNQILSAVNELEDEDVKANIESLMQAHRDAMDAERSAEDDDARAEAAEAVTAARDALNEALTAAGIEVSTEMPDGQPPEMPEGNEPPADGQQPPEKPEGDEDRTPPSDGQQPPEKPKGEVPADGQQLSEDDQNLFRLFRQFLEWLKGSNET